MIDWFIKHWPTISFVAAGIIAVIGWWGSNHGWIIKMAGWFRSKSRMNTEISDLKAQLLVEKTLSVELQSERDHLASKFDPSGIEPPEIAIIRLLAVRGRGITGQGLATQTLLTLTRFDYHIDRLERTFHFVRLHVRADSNPSAWFLTQNGKAYAVKNNLDKAQQSDPPNTHPMARPLR